MNSPVGVQSGGPAVGSQPALPYRSQRHHFGIRARVTAAFAAGAAALSGALAASTFVLARHYLLNQRESVATVATYANAGVVERELADGRVDLGQALSSLTMAQGTSAFLYRDGTWYSTEVSVGAEGVSRPVLLPSSLVEVVERGTPARQREAIGNQPGVAVGVPLPSVGADYFEVHSLSELSATLEVLASVVFACAAATTIAGLLVGRWASGRLVRPLRGIADVASAISGGALDKRLPEAADRDLAVLSNSFNDMVAALEERIKRDARFASDVSHELRSPLTTIQATVEVLQGSAGSLPADGLLAMGMLKQEVARFSSMVQDLLEMARFDAAAGELDLEELALDDLVANTVRAYPDRLVPVFVSPGATNTWVMGDRRRLQRALVNLLDNAKAYAGGAVGVYVERDGNYAEVTVDDAGPGVQPCERGAIFERFYRGAAAGRRAASPGSGLGLALVEEHVRAHGGWVDVAERPGGGARFIVRLPVTTLGGTVGS
ncbi:MAG TPA: HAMP domain-containing sensor histidine kinase [Acidimicrobiales bacterium]|nr:HAMP domain-containing sensor histidine kinase [Acidimicrobiales bacterium]